MTICRGMVDWNQQRNGARNALFISQHCFSLLVYLPKTHRLRTGLWFSLVQFSHSVVSNSLRPHEPQHARPPCPSPTPRVYPNSRSLSRWCHPTISSSVVPFSSHPQSLPASGSFPMSQLFTSGGQSIGVSASTSNPSNEHPGLISFRMDWLDLLKKIFLINKMKGMPFRHMLKWIT